MEGGYRETEVRLDGWREDGLGQQRDNDGGAVRNIVRSVEPRYICR